MIVIDSGEKPYVFEAFEEKGIPYKKEEIKAYYCNDCGKTYWEIPENEGCNKDNFTRFRVADFTNEERTFAVERKTENDFWSSMIDKSLHDQLKRMSLLDTNFKVLLLEGFISNIQISHEKQNNWIASMPSVAMQFGLSFMQTDDITYTVEQINWMDKKSKQAPKIYTDDAKDKYWGKKEGDSFVPFSDAKKFLCRLINVSDKKADVLLEELRNPWEVIRIIKETNVLYTKTGNPKGIDGPLSGVKGFGYKFILDNQALLANLR